MSKSMIRPLDEILAYQNQAAIDRFTAVHPEAKEEAQLIFDDLKRFLWLCASLDEEAQQGKEVPDISFPTSMLIIDEMWHAFILLTQSYTHFCQHYLGHYIHHPTPMPKYEHNSQSKNEAECMEIFLSEMITCVYERLGEEVAGRWFDYYEKYGHSMH